tara:strand:+ start:3523 stop:4122 length:600 start_codon:yes stop_codon:yes gene_type:complete
MYDYMFRFILLGDCGVGKTAYASKLMDLTFDDKYMTTIGVEFFTKTIMIDKYIIKCQIWDTAGQESFAPLVKCYYKDIAGAILIFDVNDKDSFDNLKDWLCKLNVNGPSHYPFSKLIIGNKTDLNKRKIKYTDAELFAHRNGCLYSELSVKNDNILSSLQLISKDIFTFKDKNKGVRLGYKNVNLKIDNKNRDSCCNIC